MYWVNSNLKRQISNQSTKWLGIGQNSDQSTQWLGIRQNSDQSTQWLGIRQNSDQLVISNVICRSEFIVHFVV